MPIPIVVGGPSSVPPPAHTPVLEPWLFGMSKADVSKIERYGSYQAVTSTGGVETANGIFNGKKADISFIFDDQGLTRIQVWAYEGRSVDEATEAWKCAGLFVLHEAADSRLAVLFRVSLLQSPLISRPGERCRKRSACTHAAMGQARQ